MLCQHRSVAQSPSRPQGSPPHCHRSVLSDPKWATSAHLQHTVAQTGLPPCRIVTQASARRVRLSNSWITPRWSWIYTKAPRGAWSNSCRCFKSKEFIKLGTQNNIWRRCYACFKGNKYVERCTPMEQRRYSQSNKYMVSIFREKWN